MKFYIDTNTFPTNPALYADAEKSKRIPQILPVVQLTRGALQIGFLGENPPPDGALVEFSATIAGTNTQVVLARGEKTASGDAWEFNLNFNSEALSIALESKHADVMLIAGIIVSTEAFRQEWQLRLSASETATGELDPKQVESARDFADVAERSATRAEGAAQYAELSSRDASESAEAAQASAEAAGKSQEAAAQSAREAAQSRTDAVSAKDAAEAAKTDAEKAKTDAEAAKAGAERARDDASEILRNVENEAESVVSAGEQALANIETAKQDAKAEIDAFTDVYTKAETYSKSQIDGVATGAEVTKAMNNAAEQLLVSQGIFEGFYMTLIDILSAWSKTNAAEWDTCFDVLKSAIERFRENPVVDKVYDIDNPPPADTRPFIDFNVLSIGGRAYGDYMSVENRGIFYLPNANAAKFLRLTGQTNGVYVSVENAADIQSILTGCKTTGNVYLFAPKSTDAHLLAMGVSAKRIFARLGNITKSNQSFWDTNVDEVFIECDSFEGNYRAFDGSKARKVAIRSGRPVSSLSSTFRFMPNLVELEVDLTDTTSLYDTLVGSGLFNSPVTIPKCKNAQGAFKNTAMSAANIAATLDSLPTWTDGASHVITFTGSPGAAELTQDSPSVATAVARGWTVEL